MAEPCSVGHPSAGGSVSDRKQVWNGLISLHTARALATRKLVYSCIGV